MKNVLLVMASTDASDEAIEYAVSLAQKNSAGVSAVYLLHTGPVREAFDAFTDTGFIGDKPSSEVSESLMRAYRQRGYEELGRVQIKAMEAGVEFEPLLEEGELQSRVLEFIERRGAIAVVLVKKKGRLAGYFSKSPVEELKKRTSIEVTVFETEY